MRILIAILLGVLASLRFTPCLAKSQFSKDWKGYEISEEISKEKFELYAGIFPQIDYAAYGDTYTEAELAALEKALWTQNMTLFDLAFDKHFGKGHRCYPLVLTMMQEPLVIGTQIDAFANRLPSDFNPLAIATALENKAGWFEPTFIANYEQQSIKSWIPEFEVQPKPTVEELFRDVTTPLQLLNIMAEMMSSQVMGGLNSPRHVGSWDVLREILPERVVWHPVPSALTDEEFAREYFRRPDFDLEQWHKDIDEKYADDTLAAFESAAGMSINLHNENRLGWLLTADPRQWIDRVPASAWPQDKPLVIETGAGRIALGTPHNDVYSGDYACLVDPGGDDVYYDGRYGTCFGLHAKRLGYFVDMAGNDMYDCGNTDVTLGAAILGFGFFYDLGGGNDRYYAGSVSLGAAIGGVATFYDDGGSDYYSGKVYTQGAAGFGIAVMCDDSVKPAPQIPTDVETPDPIDLASFDNDHYTAWCEAQGFARTRGVAICSNARGNEVYHAGGVYLHAPLFSDRYQSFSQGFAIGERDIDYAGGIALLADYSGNDRYLGDVYNQGVGYWYSAGFLYDGGGNDHYEMTQYGQGSGIHLAVGGLIDESGSDCYIIHNGLGQGSSHDYAASLLMDRGGDDRYLGNTTCNGSAVTNSVGLFFDRGGNDIYAGKRRDAINYGGVARGFGSIGVFVDVVGEDDYLGQMADDTLWTHKQYGVGIDLGPTLVLPGVPALEAPAVKPAGFDTPSANPVLPDVLSYEGPLKQAVFDELWELAIRWEVGDNRVIVPAARKKLASYAEAVYPFLEERMGDKDTGLASRAQVDVIKQVREKASEIEGSLAIPLSELMLARQLTSLDEARMRNALQIVAEIKLTDSGPLVAAFLNSPDPALQRRAVSVLGTIGSHAADDQLLALLKPGTEEKLLKVAVEAVTNLDIDRFDLLIPLLDHPSFAVRDTLVRQLAAHIGTYENELREFVYRQHLWPRSQLAASPTALRSAYRVYANASFVPPESILELFWMPTIQDSGIRLDAARAVRRWAELAEDEEFKRRLRYHADKLEASAAPADRVLQIVP